MQATEDFFQLVLNAHIIAAAQKIIGQNDTVTVDSVARFVNKYIRLDATDIENDDMIHNYACDSGNDLGQLLRRNT